MLKGFEEYAALNGYCVIFSADNSFQNKIAFKFTLIDPDISIGSEKVRSDFKDYLEKLSNGDTFEDIPRIVSIEEHNLLITILKSRISFLQHVYNLEKFTSEYYKKLLNSSSALCPNVIVNKGGVYNDQGYKFINSPHAVFGEDVNSYSFRFAINEKDRKKQIDCLSEVLIKLSDEAKTSQVIQAMNDVENVKKELDKNDAPSHTRISNWLNNIKILLQSGGLCYETVDALKNLFNSFGVSIS